tara:strand:- start:70206 stop:70406 length:201 start_codon:yes stop_codon:yes gene_type:complete
MRKRILTTFTDGDIDVEWAMTGIRMNIITYGQHSIKYVDNAQAAAEFGSCVRHSLECAGKFDEVQP